MRETALKVSFELSPRDVRYFREQLKIARKSRSESEGTDETVIQSATEVEIGCLVLEDRRFESRLIV